MAVPGIFASTDGAVQYLDIGDMVEFVFPDPADATFAGPAITLRGELSCVAEPLPSGCPMTILQYPPATAQTVVTGMSSDGSILVGYNHQDTPPKDEALKWDRSTGAYVVLDQLSGTLISQVSSVTRDGTIIVGTAHDGSSQRAVYWDAGGAVTALTDPVGKTENSGAFAASDDGSIIVGIATNSGLVYPVMWNPSPTVLTLLSGGTFAYAQDCSADGSIIVGYGDTGVGDVQAIVWTSGTPTALTIPGGFVGASATACNSDGSKIAGFVYDVSAHISYAVWDAGVPTVLGLLDDDPDAFPSININDDGTVVVGSSQGGSNTRAARWTNLVIHQVGTDNTVAAAVSADGQVIGGSFYDGVRSLPVYWECTD